MSLIFHNTNKSYDSIQRFRFRCSLSTNPNFIHLFTAHELSINTILHEKLSLPALYILSRLEKKRRHAFFHLNNLHQLFSKYLVSESIFQFAIQELLFNEFLIQINYDSYTQSPTSFNANSTYLPPTVDPFGIFLILSIEEIQKIIVQVGGAVEGLWRQCRSNKIKFSKYSFILQLNQLCSETGTLSGKKLKNILLSVIFNNHKDIIAFPTFWKSFFQKLDFLETASTLDPDIFLHVGSHEFLSSPLISQCDSCLRLSKLPSCFYVERSSLPCMCSFKNDGNPCTLSFDEKKQTRKIFPTQKDYNLFEIARFVHKVVAVTVREKQYEQLQSLTSSLETILYRFLNKKNFAIKGANEKSFKFPNPYFATLEETKAFLYSLEHPYFASFTFEYVIALAAYILVKGYKVKGRNPLTSIRLLELLLETNLLPSKRIKMYNRLAIYFFLTIKQPQLALQASLCVFNEPYNTLLPHAVMFETAERLKRILKSCFQVSHPVLKNKKKSKRKNNVDNSQEFDWFWCLPKILRLRVIALLKTRSFNEEKIPRRIIQGNSIPRLVATTKHLSVVEENTSFWGRAKFISETDTVILVEQYALEWYRQQNIFQQKTSQLTGLHDEGSIFLEIFGILMHDILFDMTIPDVFIYTSQNAPLDLFSEKFYIHRKKKISNWLETLQNFSSSEIFFETLKRAISLYSKDIINVSWKILFRVHQTEHGRKWWNTYYERLCQSFNWNVTKKYMSLCLNKTGNYQTISSSTFFDNAEKFDSASPNCPYNQCLFLAIIASSIKPKILSVILNTLAMNYGVMSHGLPDLILWQVFDIENENVQFSLPSMFIKFVEVKSQNDRLSEKQRQWLGIILDAGADAELFLIRDLRDGQLGRSKTAFEKNAFV